MAELEAKYGAEYDRLFGAEPVSAIPGRVANPLTEEEVAELDYLIGLVGYQTDQPIPDRVFELWERELVWGGYLGPSNG